MLLEMVEFDTSMFKGLKKGDQKCKHENVETVLVHADSDPSAIIPRSKCINCGKFLEIP